MVAEVEAAVGTSGGETMARYVEREDEEGEEEMDEERTRMADLGPA
jgi:hypothetical protein